MALNKEHIDRILGGPYAKFQVSGEFAKQMRENRVRVALHHAWTSYEAQSLSAQFGGDGKPVTRANVAAEFGEAAAIHWQQIIDAKAAFYKSLKESG